MNRKRAVQIASVASMIDQFIMPNIKILQALGYQVDVIADFSNPGNISRKRLIELQDKLDDMDVKVFDVAIPRKIIINQVLNSYKTIYDILVNNNYNIVHCHSPIGAAITRFACRKLRSDNLKVIYTAHGFHFYNGAPLSNWLVYYPIEKLLSFYTDVLIVINKEDYNRANKHFKMKKLFYVPGIGVDTDKFCPNKNAGLKIREELNLDIKRKIVLSVGELNKNKNHEIVLKAISEYRDITYIIVGIGPLWDKLKKLAALYNVDLRLVGYRDDVVNFYNACDLFILPSFREGLNVSLMEAMACGVPCLVSDIRGNNDLIDYNKGGLLFNPFDLKSVHNSIETILNCNLLEYGKYNTSRIKLNSKEKINKMIYEIYNTLF